MATINVASVLSESKFNRFHWMLFFFGIFIIACDGYDLTIYGTVVPILMKEWGLTPSQAGVIGSYALFGACIGSPLFGYLATMFGRKRTLLLCIIMFSVFTGLTGITKDPSVFSILRFLTGLAVGGSMPILIAVVTEYAPKRNRALMIGSIFSGMQVGGIAASLLSMWLFPLFGWQSVFYGGALPLLLVPFLIKYFPEAPTKYVKSNQMEKLKEVLQKARPDLLLAENDRIEVEQGNKRSPILSVFAEHKAISTIAIWVVFIMGNYMIYGMWVWLPKLMMEMGFGLGSSLWFLFTLNIGAWIGIQVTGLLADRFGHKTMLYIAYLLSFTLIASLTSVNDFALLTFLVGLAGAGYMGAQSLIIAYSSLFYPPLIRSTGSGLALGVGRFGAIFGPAVTGVILEMNLPLYANFLGLAVPALIACSSLYFIQDKYSFSYRGAKKD